MYARNRSPIQRPLVRPERPLEGLQERPLERERLELLFGEELERQLAQRVDGVRGHVCIRVGPRSRAKCAARTRHMRSQASRGLKWTFISATSTNRCKAATRGRLGSPSAGRGCKSSYFPPGLKSDSSRKYCVPLLGSPVDSSAADTAHNSATNLSTPTADNLVERAYSSSREASVSTEQRRQGPGAFLVPQFPIGVLLLVWLMGGREVGVVGPCSRRE